MDMGMAGLAAVGLIIVAGGGGWLAGLIKGKKNKKSDS